MPRLSQDAAGQIIGAEVQDELEGGKPFPVHARVVINAGGPFSDSIRQMSDEKVWLRTHDGTNVEALKLM